MGIQLVLAIVIPLFHLAGLILAAHAILFTRTSQGAIAWALSLIFFPYLSLPLYLVFGRRKFYGYVEARRLGDRRIDHLAEHVLADVRRGQSKLTGESQRFCVLQNLALAPFCQGNRGRLLVDGPETFAAIFQAIENARHYILIQFFIVRDDRIGLALQERLIQRARAGVQVFFLYDEIGSIRLPKKYLAALRQAGVRIQPFNTRRGWRNRFQINFRNHRKIVVTDGACAYVGGHNVGDEYLGQSKRFGHWRDTHVELIGPAVAAVQWSFVEDWHWATQEILDLATLLPNEILASPQLIPAAEVAADNPGNALVISSGPADPVNTCTLMFLALISSAKKRLWITSPYFVPDETVYDALQLAALRGVDVRIMLPAKPDHILVYLASFSYFESAEQIGVKFYRYRAGFLHQKVMLVDDELGVVGTANLDNRSMRLNFEITVVFADHLFNLNVSEMLERDFEKCERATPGDVRRRGLWFRIAVRFSRLLAPVQ